MKTVTLKPWMAGVLLCTTLLGCSAVTTSNQQSYAYELIKPGASLVLHKPIRFPDYSATVNIQAGQIKSGLFSLDNYHPNCRLELRGQSGGIRTIEPDRFTIYKIDTQIEYVMNKNPVKLAGWGLHMANSVSDMVYSTILYLKSEKQPQVELLSCQHWEDPTNFPAHLTLQQISQTLAGLFTIEMP